MTDEYLTHLDELPEHMREGMQAWIETARPVGGFLTALLSNDLRETYARADSTNLLRVYDFVNYLYNYAPIGCWGSPENVEDWRTRGGLQGIRETEVKQEEARD